MMEQYSILNDLATMKSQPSRIMAMGVGGAGGNAVEHMWEMQIEGVNLAACNTDKVDLDKLHIPEENKILILGSTSTLTFSSSLKSASVKIDTSSFASGTDEVNPTAKRYFAFASAVCL